MPLNSLNKITRQFQSQKYNSQKYRLGKPKYSRIPDNDELFPLIVYLHGAGERGDENTKQIQGLKHLGNGLSFKAKSFRKNYPSFVYVPQCPEGSDWKREIVEGVIETIENLISYYPIDSHRLYLLGYSMGGSGTYELASSFYYTTGQLFTAIVRIAGQSDFKLHVHETINKSAVWLHIGHKDIPIRIEKAREAYGILKKISVNSQEIIEEFITEEKYSQTHTLMVNGFEKTKLTEYIEGGHGIPHLPFINNNVLDWLFNQRTNDPGIDSL